MMKFKSVKYLLILALTTLCIFLSINFANSFFFKYQGPITLPGGPCFGEIPQSVSFIDDLKDTNTIFRIIISDYEGPYICASEGKHQIASNIILFLQIFISFILSYLLTPLLIKFPPSVEWYLKKVIEVNKKSGK